MFRNDAGTGSAGLNGF